ncbi:hypothetical protein [methanotrophic endosymbiont of Bathymodiolus puteoserpentis (Logatchev)]|uniref:hypothetical protein n=1 Tax=methanotrophic endosymbiont of Bathymodiolus puteoserpentis (Logatchev) TaxID=343235 RepID=UPI0013CCA2AB|nr:hypothetical protein [methanotrophic endosymbiont of Bathymodiolus puteoserpentis (Logatchev)]SHE23137.1 hypothetical protein BPUTEOMOX_1067 [methanotrophic endosymbiont of Bathymodiolus puteoserpentis (Logatchev)]
MTKNKLTFIASLIIFASSTAAVQAEPYVYPAKGQSTEQMEKDKYQCYVWGKQQSGYDPMNPPVASSGQANTAPVVGGAARGAAIGATTGAIARGARNRGAQNQQQQQAQQQSTAIAQMNSEYDRAYAVCLEGRGYSVK